MSLLIKGMNMPTSCGDCRFCGGIADTDCGPCAWCDIDGKARFADTRQDCPLIEVPTPHGRLIDADALEQEMINGIKAGNHEDGKDDYTNINNMDDCVECVRYADTIIEAEEGEKE